MFVETLEHLKETKQPNTISCKNESGLFIGDCLQVLPYVQDGSVDMILCDLPYGTTRNPWDSIIDLDTLWTEYWRVLKPSGVICLTSHGLFTAKLIMSQEKAFKYKYVWVKSKATNFLNAKVQPLRKHEDICVFYKERPTYNPQMTNGKPYDKGIRKNQQTGSYNSFKQSHVKSEGLRYPTDVLYFKTAESEGTVYHPTQKPVSLGRYLVRTFTNEGDVVMDNAFGSGSFLLSAELENRKFLGIEKNEDNMRFKNEKLDCVSVAIERLTRAKGL